MNHSPHPDTQMKKIFAAAASAALLAACSVESITSPVPEVNLGICTNLQAPAGLRAISRVFATGVQVYRYDGNAWVQITPSAVLTADYEGRETVGIHYSGPTWEGIAGSKVTATVANTCTVDAGSIPWLSLNATPEATPGVFAGTTFIQRVHTTGGKAPTVAGTTGQVKSVPYTAQYFFYAPQ
jgi:hypothetical protein